MFYEEDFNHCFRCRGMAVIDKATLNHLPEVLHKIASLLYSESYDEQANEVREYALLIESLPDD